MIYNGLKDIAHKFDIFLFDAYGVFWEGNGFYAGSVEMMSQLVLEGKQVVVVSNTAMCNADTIASYERKGLLKGRDYTHFMTAGEVLHLELMNKKIFVDKKKYYVLGFLRSKCFEGTQFQRVYNCDDADFIYCGVPFLTKEQISQFSKYNDKFWPMKLDDSGEVCLWDSEILLPYDEEIEKVARTGLPIVNANPDIFAREGHPLAENSEAVFVVRNGAFAEAFRNKGCEVIEYGKPHTNIFEYVFDLLRKEDIRIDKSRICMVGDTIKTDVLGALNVGITPVLCMGTGITAWQISKGKSLNILCKEEFNDINKLIQIDSIGG